MKVEVLPGISLAANKQTTKNFGMSRPGDNKGTKNFKAKLTENDVTRIYQNKKLTQQQLAKKYHVSQSTINHIKRGRTWSWLTSKLDR